jgi:anti-sigma regulatory factor (Ser/Thr protein kinase)
MTSSADLQISTGDHVVYFYEDDRDLAVRSATYLGAALAEGGAAIAIVAAPHRPAFATELGRIGIDVAASERAGALVFLDARTTLDALLVDGAPDRTRFREVVGAAVAELARAHRPLHAFGEMVGLLWDVGDVDAVIELEQLWDELLGELSFSLLCAYPVTALNDGSADRIVRVCDGHSEVVSCLPAVPSAEAAKTYARTVESPGRAREFVAETLRAWGFGDELYDDAALVVTELAVNSIKHAMSGFTVSLTRGGRGIRISVGDADPELPVRRSLDVRATSGRGLLLVDAVAAAWGSTPRPGGKLVWADVGPADPSRR